VKLKVQERRWIWNEMEMLMKSMGHEMKWLVTHGNIKRTKARNTLYHKAWQTTQNKGKMSANMTKICS
jgi:hypothetical protein